MSDDIAPDVIAGVGIGAMPATNAVRYRDRVAYEHDGRSVTHGELADRARDLAAGLAARGVRPGDRVAILGTNSIEFGEALAACLVAGYIATTVNFRLSAREMAGIIADAGARVLFVDPAYQGYVETVVATTPTVELVVGMSPSPIPGYAAMDDIRADGQGKPLEHIATGADVGCLIYTSGTTGKPKGCVIGQSELAFVARTMNHEMRSGCADRVLIVMPMFHIGALAIILGVHVAGGTVLLQSAFHPDEAVDAIIDHDVTVLHLAPTMLDALLVAAGNRAMSTVRTVVYSAAPITQTVLDAALTAMPGAGFVNLYGQTEVITSGLPRELHRGTTEMERERLRSVGFPFPETRVRIVDAAGDDVDEGTSGEIVVSSPGVARGYWNNPAATAETFRDGWCHTGDIGRFDDAGLLYLVDRKKDIIITGGENVASIEVENVLSGHQGVVDCAVVGVPDEVWGEAVAVVAVARPGHELELTEIREFVSARIARYKAPRLLFTVDEIPKLPTGKIDKKLLRAQCAPGVSTVR